MNADNQPDFELPDDLSNEVAAQLIECLYERGRVIENRTLAQIRQPRPTNRQAPSAKRQAPSAINSRRCGTTTRRFDPNVIRNLRSIQNRALRHLTALLRRH